MSESDSQMSSASSGHSVSGSESLFSLEQYSDSISSKLSPTFSPTKSPKRATCRSTPTKLVAARSDSDAYKTSTIAPGNHQRSESDSGTIYRANSAPPEVSRASRGTTILERLESENDKAKSMIVRRNSGDLSPVKSPAVEVINLQKRQHGFFLNGLPSPVPDTAHESSDATSTIARYHSSRRTIHYSPSKSSYKSLKQLSSKTGLKKRRVARISSATEDESDWDDTSSMDTRSSRRSKRKFKRTSRKGGGILQRMANGIFDQVFGGIWFITSPLISCFTVIAIASITLYLVSLFLVTFISSRLGFAGPTLLGPIKAIGSSMISIPRLGVANIFGAVCTISGFGCMQETKPIQLAEIAQETIKNAETAKTIFDNLILMSHKDYAGTNLHQAALWELSVAARHSSEWANKEYIADQLEEMGNIARNLHDAVIRLNSQGINSFSWIVYQFSRIEDTLVRLERNPNTISSEGLQSLLDQFYETISRDLTTLLESIDKLFPIAEDGHSLGLQLMGLLTQEKGIGERAKVEKTMIQKVLERKTWKSRQLEKDLRLAESGLAWVSNVHTSMESVRSSIIAYQDHVAGFKSGVIGYALAADSLLPEDDIRSLTRIMNEFRRAVSEVKEKSRSPPNLKPVSLPVGAWKL